ncbi:Transcription repressor OFP6 [Striga hermonthica]|uniref:Transcription repressor n=1 Tax=Striga hermonthica TaxID=68872 RepID=A0A9N7N7M9_STRHE|nr:Transcription repressor OFP6 [Striga hermonthica]
MSGGKKNHHNILHTVAVKLSCCRRPRPSSAFSPSQRRPAQPLSGHHLRRRRHPHSSPSAATWDTTTTTVSTSPPASYSGDAPGFGGVAVEKDSDDPYLDFRRSMLQMILEREIYSRDELKELLDCFLRLNDPYYHGIIVRAFTEIWNGGPPGNHGPNSGWWFPGGY